MLGKLSQLWPGRLALEPEFVLDAERKAFQAPLGKLADPASLSPHIPSLDQPTAYSESESGGGRGRSGLPTGPFLIGPLFLWLLRGMCSQAGVAEKLWSEADAGLHCFCPNA